jgi:hypothetical protein
MTVQNMLAECSRFRGKRRISEPFDRTEENHFASPPAGEGGLAGLQAFGPQRSGPDVRSPKEAPWYVIPAKAGIQLFFSGFLLAQE